MTTLWLDLETYSTVPIKHGAHRYAEEAEVLLVAVAVDGEPTQVWDCTQGHADWRKRLQALINAADTVVIHNSAFDRTVLRHCGVHVPLEKVEDTMVLALAHSLPASLGTLCDILGVPVVRPVVTETTALGAAYLAGLGVGLWKSPSEIASQWQAERRFKPAMTAAKRKMLMAGWARALERARNE